MLPLATLFELTKSNASERSVNMLGIQISYLIIVGLSVLSLWSLWMNIRQWWLGRRKDKEIASRLQGAAVGRGLMAEQFAPFTETFKHLGWNIQEF